MFLKWRDGMPDYKVEIFVNLTDKESGEPLYTITDSRILSLPGDHFQIDIPVQIVKGGFFIPLIYELSEHSGSTKRFPSPAFFSRALEGLDKP